MSVMPHDHRAAAAIGIYAGREDNVLWRRVGAVRGGAGRVEPARGKTLADRECAVLGRGIIHSVTNPPPRPTGAIHVRWGGDFSWDGKSGRDSEAPRERPYDEEEVARLFEEANAALGAARRFAPGGGDPPWLASK
jgi:predicted metal-dependent enzyme (double-stranded beta helix superfamily)